MEATQIMIPEEKALNLTKVGSNDAYGSQTLFKSQSGLFSPKQLALFYFGFIFWENELFPSLHPEKLLHRRVN